MLKSAHSENRTHTLADNILNVACLPVPPYGLSTRYQTRTDTVLILNQPSPANWTNRAYRGNQIRTDKQQGLSLPAIPIRLYHEIRQKGIEPSSLRDVGV